MPAFDEVPDLRRPVHGETVSGSGFVKPTPLALEGQYVRLGRVDVDADAAELFACGHAGDAEALWRFMPYGPFASQEQMAAWLAACAASADPLWLVAWTKPGRSAVGMAAFMNVRDDVGVAEIGHIWLGPAHQRTREATEALFLMMDHVLTGCRYRRLEWKCDALNARSRRAARRLGFRYEGTFYNHGIVKGRNRDTAWFAILESEWAPLRDRLLAWLDPANFNAN
ncbi:MAG TPA: GNAT family protein, partial [Rhodospirillales bacterium]|nr:GNAT family protein [Rhodospirillales bacterium]